MFSIWCILEGCVLCAKSLQPCPTLCDTMDCSPPASSVHGTLQARIMKWIAMPFSKRIFPTPGLNPCLLSLQHWLMAYLPLVFKNPSQKNPTKMHLTNSSVSEASTCIHRYKMREGVLFSCSIMSNSLGSHGLQYAKLLCPSSTPRVCSNSRSSSRWYHPTISSSVVSFSCLQSFPVSGSFPMMQFFVLGDQSIGASASALMLPLNIQGWFPLGWLVWYPFSPRGSQESSTILQFKRINSLVLSFL